MTHEQFLAWLDSEIEKAAKKDEIESLKYEGDLSHSGRVNALEEVKEKFITLTPPPTTLS